MGHFNWVLQTQWGFVTEILGGDGFQSDFFSKAFSLAHRQKTALTFGYHI